MSRLFSLLSVAALLTTFCCAPAQALPPDDYLGDSSIYVGVPNQRPRPNVLIIIDTSRATMGLAAGDKYEASDISYNTGTYVADRIYTSNQQGGFSPSRPLGGNNPTTLLDVTCTVTYETVDPGTEENVTNTVNVHDILAEYGTYSGGGSAHAPNLSGTGGCATAPNGEVYATGHYLNYINSTATLPVTDTIIIQHTYQLWEKVGKIFQWVTYTDKFELIRNIDQAVASMEPGVGSQRAIYWSKLGKSDKRVPTYEIDATGNLVPGFTGRDGWHLDVKYYSLALDPDAGSINTQRKAFYDALVPVISGASPSVNFGFLTYNPQNQGAVIGADIREYGPNPSSLIAALPSMATCAYRENPQTGVKDWDCPDLIASGPNRPQSEALYDAGYYLQAVYSKTDGSSPNKQSINIVTQVPDPNPCGYNHIIFLTNGLPNQDTNTPNLGDWDGDGYEAISTDYGLGTHWIDDVAYFLSHEADVNGDGKKGDITTHVVLAFQAEDALMRQTAVNGGGAFYNVFDTQGLTEALQEIINNIVSESNTAFVAPVVPASSTNRTVSSNRVYLGLFKPQNNAPWHGNLKKYRVSTGNELLDVHGHRATDVNGDFIYSQSYWGTKVLDDGSVKILSAEDPRLRNVVPVTYNPDSGTPDEDGGDGGIVDAGGVGGTLLARDFSTNPRKIYTYLTPTNSIVSSVNADLTTSQNVFSTANTACSGNNCITAATLGLPDTTNLERLIDYVHGYNSFGGIYPTTVKRNWILGDILHSRPLLFNYTKYIDNVETENTCYPPNSTSLPIPTHLTGTIPPYATYNTTFAFVGANDGMMHAFRDCDGEEAWAFIPPVVLDDLKLLPQSGHEYFVDGAPTVYVHDYDGDGNIEPSSENDGDKVILLFGLRRGGGNAYLSASDPRGAYYALDITDPLNPKFMWEIKGGGASTNPYFEMGETWSQPRLAKIKDGTTDKVVMFIGAGYDNNEDRRWGNTQSFPVSTVTSPVNPETDTNTTLATNDGDSGPNNGGVTSATGGSQLNPKGRGLYLVEIATLAKDGNNKFVPSFTNSGAKVWGYTYGATNTITTNSSMTFSIPSDLAVLDWDDDGYIDRVYVGDTGGQLWRFSLPLTVEENIRKGIKTNWTADVIFRSNPGADLTNGRKFFYRPSVARYGSYTRLYFGSGDREHPLNLAIVDRMYMLIDRGQGLTNTTDGMGVKTESDLMDVTANTLQESSDSTAIDSILSGLNSTTNYGWYIKLENPGEKMLAPSLIFFGQAFYTTYAPLTSGQANCEVGNLGVSRLYHLDFLTGEAVFNYNKSNDSSTTTNERAKGEGGAVLMKSDRVRTLGEGIPSGIVTLMDASGKVTMLISASNRVGAYAAPDVKLITPVYWMQWNN